MELNFLVQGSDPEPYEVTFMRHAECVNVFCTCKAGSFGTLCKHRLNIIAGDSKHIVSDNVEKIPTVQSWIAESAIAEPIADLYRTQKELEKLQKKVRAVKKQIARLMEAN